MAHTVVFKSIEGVNFFRFGNEPFLFNFNFGITGLFGNNGLGKSAVIDAVCVCLFNETYRDSNKSDWTNNINKTGLLIKGVIETHSTTIDTYQIIRQPLARKASEVIKIFKNDVEVNNIANYQEYIENVILGFNINLFRNSIAVSADTPFISMTPEQKRQFSDNLFSIKQVREFKKKASEASSECLMSKRIIDRDVENINLKIKEYENIIRMSVNNDDERIEKLKADILEMESNKSQWENIPVLNEKEIADNNAILNNLNLELADLQLKLKELDPQTINREVITAKSKLETCKRDYIREKNDRDRIAPNVICNSCGNSFSEEQAETHKLKHTENMNRLASEGTALKLEVASYDEKLNEISTLNSKISQIAHVSIRDVTNKISSLKHGSDIARNNIAQLNSNIERYNREIENIQSKEDTSNVSDFAQQSIIAAKEEIEKKTVELAEVNRKIAAYAYIINMCSDNGIKNMLLKKFIPLLNTLISYYLSKFRLPLQVEFDEFFKHKITAELGIGQKHSLLSKGQKKRIDVAILFAIVDLIKMMGNFKCNLLILDEFADGNVDKEGFSDIIHMIRNVCDKGDKSIVVVSHKNEDVLYDSLDYMYELELKNQFSILKEVPVYR